MTDGSEKLLIRDAIDSHRYLRHDFMNDIQVITGFMQIGQVDKALAYCKNAAVNLQVFQPLSKIKLPYLESFFLCYMTLLNSTRQLLHIVIEEDLDNWREEDCNLTEIFRQLLGICRDDILDKKMEFYLHYVQPSTIDAQVRYFHKIPPGKAAKIEQAMKQKHYDNLEVSITENSAQVIRIFIKKKDVFRTPASG